MSFPKHNSVAEKRAARRLAKEYAILLSNPLENCAASPMMNANGDVTDLFEWHVNLTSTYREFEGTHFHFVMKFPENYPDCPPEVEPQSYIDHPNVFGDWICLDILKSHTARIPHRGWTNAYTVSSILVQLQSFLFEVRPNYRNVERMISSASQFRCTCGHHETKAFPEVEHQVIDGTAFQIGDIVLLKGIKTAKLMKLNWQYGTLLGQLKDRRWRVQLEKVILTTAISCLSKVSYRVGETVEYRNAKKKWCSAMVISVAPLTVKNTDGAVIERIPNHVRKIETKYSPRTYIVVYEDGVLVRNGISLSSEKSYRLKYNAKVEIVKVQQNTVERRIRGQLSDGNWVSIEDMNDGYQWLLPCNTMTPMNKTTPVESPEDSVSGLYYFDILPMDLFQTLQTFFTWKDLMKICSVSEEFGHSMLLNKKLQMESYRCFYSLMDATDKDTILGYGVQCIRMDKRSRVTNQKKMCLQKLHVSFDIMSYDAYDRCNIRNNIWKDFSVDNFLPLYINAEHGSRAMRLNKTHLPSLVNDGSELTAETIIQTYGKAMNTIVVDMMLSVKNVTTGQLKLMDSIKALEGYMALHHTLLAYAIEYPQLVDQCKERVGKFIRNVQARDKEVVPDIGELLIAMSLTDYSWSEFVLAWLEESMIRGARWTLSKFPNLLRKEKEFSCIRLNQTYTATKTGKRLAMFQRFFIERIACPPELEGNPEKNKILFRQYNERCGRPPVGLAEELQQHSRTVLACEDWYSFFNLVGFAAPSSINLWKWLLNAIEISERKDYHQVHKILRYTEHHLKSPRDPFHCHSINCMCSGQIKKMKDINANQCKLRRSEWGSCAAARRWNEFAANQSDDVQRMMKRFKPWAKLTSKKLSYYAQIPSFNCMKAKPISLTEEKWIDLGILQGTWMVDGSREIIEVIVVKNNHAEMKFRHYAGQYITQEGSQDFEIRDLGQHFEFVNEQSQQSGRRYILPKKKTDKEDFDTLFWIIKSRKSQVGGLTWKRADDSVLDKFDNNTLENEVGNLDAINYQAMMQQQLYQQQLYMHQYQIQQYMYIQQMQQMAQFGLLEEYRRNQAYVGDQISYMTTCAAGLQCFVTNQPLVVRADKDPASAIVHELPKDTMIKISCTFRDRGYVVDPVIGWCCLSSPSVASPTIEWQRSYLSS